MKSLITVDEIVPELTASYKRSLQIISELSENDEFMEKAAERQHNTGKPDSDSAYQSNADYLINTICVFHD